MEQPPNEEKIHDSRQEQELSFDQKIALATALNKAVDERNIFIKRQGGFDTFAEVGQHVGDMKASYDTLEDDVSRARQEFDSKIHNKKEFVEKLRGLEENALADRIASMFGVRKESIFSRIFKK